MMEIVEGTPHDIASIMPVMNDAFEADYGEAWTAAQCLAALSVPGSQLLLARSDDGIVTGFAMTRWVLDEEELLMIGVGRKWRNNNIASLLLNEIRKKAIAANRSKLFLEVREDNPARQFYEKSGFSSIRIRKEYYVGKDGKHRNAVTMQVNL